MEWKHYHRELRDETENESSDVDGERPWVVVCIMR